VPEVLPNIRDRQVLQRLLSGEWKNIFRLDILVGALQLKRLVALGWVEQREQDGKPQIRITSEGLSAFKARKR
jgi:hypothetical protein